MNWHETIVYIRTKPEFSDLVKDAYFDPNLENNIERFREGSEYKETLYLIKEHAPNSKSILDIGAGNGISSINFARDGYAVTVVEPDPSDTIGAKAIRYLAKAYSLKNISVYENKAEAIKFPDESFDVVYVRQAMHHANDLISFIHEAVRVLKKGGLLLTIRDHVIFDALDKEYFFQNHPLHKFYGGENAYRPEEYKEAFHKANLTILKELKYFDSSINYFPQTEESINKQKQDALQNLKESLKNKIGVLAYIPFVLSLYKLKNGHIKGSDHYFEKMVSGRMYSYLLRK